MIGAPLPIAILENRYERNPTTLVMEFVNTIKGNQFLALVDFTAPTQPRFTAKGAGKYLVIWQSETKREAMSVEITQPTALNVDRLRNQWDPWIVDQMLSVEYDVIPHPTLGAGSVKWVVDSFTKQQRKYMPFEHVSHTIMVDLDTDEECVLNVESASSETDRQWMLLVWRMSPAPTLEHRPLTNILDDTWTATSGITVTRLTPSEPYIVNRYRVICTSGTAGKITFPYAYPPAGYAYTVRLKLFRDETDTTLAAGKTVSARLLKNTTVLTTSATLPIPTDTSSTEWSTSVSSGVFSGSHPDEAKIEIMEIDAGDRFEFEIAMEVV